MPFLTVVSANVDFGLDRVQSTEYRVSKQDSKRQVKKKRVMVCFYVCVYLGFEECISIIIIMVVVLMAVCVLCSMLLCIITISLTTDY